jgi:hypothetical protein
MSLGPNTPTASCYLEHQEHCRSTLLPEKVMDNRNLELYPGYLSAIFQSDDGRSRLFCIVLYVVDINIKVY